MYSKFRWAAILAILVLTLGVSWLRPGSAMFAAQKSDSEGEPLDYYFMIANEAGNISNPAVEYDSVHNEYLVIWQSNPPQETHIYAERVSAQGIPLGRSTVSPPLNIERRNPDLAYNSQRDTFLVVWEQFNGTYYNIHGRIFHPNGAIGNEFILGTGTALANRYKPAVAYASTSDKFLVVWERREVQNAPGDIAAQVVSGTGAMEGLNFYICVGSTSISCHEPELAYNRSRNEYLVAWSQEDLTVVNQTDIFATRVTRDGILLDTPPLVIGYHTVPETVPVVAAIPTVPDQGGYMVAWEAHYTASDHDIYSRTVTGTGTLNSVGMITDSASNEVAPAIAGQENRDQYLVTFTRYATLPFTNSEIFGRAANTSGSLTGDEKKIVPLHGKFPAVIGGQGSDYLVVCENTQLDGTIDIVGRLWGDRSFLYLPILKK